jgi:hypothetical protein
MSIDKDLQQLLERLKTALGKRLVSVVLYGSAASEDTHSGFSDLNIFCLLEEVTSKELGAAEPVVRWWRGRGHPAPLLMSRQEAAQSADCFPIEFHDIAERRRVLQGEDFLASLPLDDRYYRAQVEHELRAKLIRLRQKAAGLLSEKHLLDRLMADSLSTFCVLARHALRLQGRPAPWTKRGLLAAFQEAFGAEPKAFTALLEMREGKGRPRDSTRWRCLSCT